MDQTDTSFAWKITEQWRVLGRWHYDLRANRSMDLMAGIEQQNCCTAIRFSYVKYLRPNPGVPGNPGNLGAKKYEDAFFIQFVFKGFAGIGHSRLSTSSRNIPGYQWRGADF